MAFLVELTCHEMKLVLVSCSVLHQLLYYLNPLLPTLGVITLEYEDVFILVHVLFKSIFSEIVE